ncbi:hypothetical protein BKH43_06810 [Helicobacter sp. 13S00401-1]|uniref:glycosyltransferase family 2 protein n=1 Tax=Helicobacter sp. 13S00401-1 TaxID=1905758 RepID=UPI000BDCC8E4|nr:glycosyltransferase family 2 protein [Helicobacter sp. 13S00401-1]PAF49355.1 hypothetical protein BKH43_06810 [Helicobacter sp. 13S00401-1]
MPPFISIIIPVFNVEKYIARCLESCINQTLKDIEIIIVDDCGSDKSIEIAKGYASKDTRIKIVSNLKNLGTFHTRLEGVKNAVGRYILFVDSDDFLELDACEVLKNIALNTLKLKKDIDDIDIINFKSNFILSKTTRVNKKDLLLHKTRYILPTAFNKGPLKDEQIAFNFFLKSYHFPKFTLWDKAYKRSLVLKSMEVLKSINRPLSMAEDMLMFYVISLLAKSYIGIDKRLYNYCLNPSSITKATSEASLEKKKDDMTYIGNTLLELSKNNALKSNKYAYKIAFRMSENLKSINILEDRFNIKDGKSIYLKKCKESLKHWNRNLTYVRLLAYILSAGKIKL